MHGHTSHLSLSHIHTRDAHTVSDRHKHMHAYRHRQARTQRFFEFFFVSDLWGGCSTSGMAWKEPGRVGDSPIIGSGLYVDNDVCYCLY